MPDLCTSCQRSYHLAVSRKPPVRGPLFVTETTRWMADAEARFEENTQRLLRSIADRCARHQGRVHDIPVVPLG